ncbi:MAG: hypothetical protein PHT69_07790 [Bacteroidales bacterium]|nr:hypothetical protein [Bacteroidales bacterium]
MKNILSIVSISVIILSLLLIISCQKPERINKIYTDSVQLIGTSVIAKGKIIDISESSIDEYGFCIAIHDDPSVNDSKVSINESCKIGSFSSPIKNLIPYTTYFIRSFLFDGANFIYGNTLSFSINSLDSIHIITAIPQILSTSCVNVSGSIMGISSVPLQDFGHCWSTEPGPTIANNKTSYGFTEKDTTFSSTMYNLNLSTPYYVRTYAITNGTNVLYGNETTFMIPDLIVFTDTFSFNGLTDVILTGEIVQLGVNPVTDYGFCWSYTSPTPTINDNTVSLGSTQTTGPYNDSMSITNGVTYYFRAFATDGIHVKYGSVKNFTKQ